MAPVKQKHIRDNQSPFMNKDIHKAIMTRTRLRNRLLKEPTPMNELAFKNKGITKVADTFNKYFVNIGNTLKIDKDKRFLVETNDVFDLVLRAIKKYSFHPSILSIKEKMNNNVFFFQNVSYEEILNEINSLQNFNNALLKCQPVSILPSLSKIYERLIYHQIHQMTENALSTFKCGFRKKNIALSMLS